ncbi:cytochrome c oxidase assembly protein [Gilvimarinus algae]|uniref:Cytochrome c oxidase assembly protein CtaG n=1 Tax=Gilvimarinus algae TaxID=3058037 RepID=A0ABT8TCA4_9GAMM|nr:cytochrome c oxidase assembly protein [Gilvimarinus sp. SDUM040014]MDO3381737.1 cytochrome c oxidase assembly protein [Gilvimarinus sp. SDUM040014]
MKVLPEDPVKRLSVKLAITSFGFLLFALFVMPPLYVAFCEITGLNGKTGDKYEAVDAVVDTSREIKVQFVATNNEGMPWQFGPEVKTLIVHPGEQTRINYLAKNPTGNDMIGQAIPSLIPYKAASYFHKTECFCFNQQALLAGEEAVLPMFFIIDQDLPEHIKSITLSYTIFDVTDRFSREELLSMVDTGQ